MSIVILIVILVIALVVAIFLITGLTGAPYVPTHRQEFAKSLDRLLPLGSSDTLIDLGAGDGTILALVAQKGARAIGVELNPLLALFMKIRFRDCSNITIKCRNLYHFRFPSSTTVVYTFAAGPHIEPIHRKIQREATRLGKPLYFISNAFDLKDVKPQKHVGQFYLYRISPLDSGSN